jgi:predicted dehydrogenase
MVGFNRRFAPLITEMKSFFKMRKEPMVMHYRVNAGYKEKNDWYQDKDIGGGRIIGEVCHFIDTYQYLTDALPVSVFAQTIKTDNHATTL